MLMRQNVNNDIIKHAPIHLVKFTYLHKGSNLLQRPNKSITKCHKHKYYEYTGGVTFLICYPGAWLIRLVVIFAGRCSKCYPSQMVKSPRIPEQEING